MREAGRVARMKQKRAYTVLMGNPKRKRPLGEHRKWKGNIKMNRKYDELVCGMVRVAQDVPVAGFCEHGSEFWVP